MGIIQQNHGKVTGAISVCATGSVKKQTAQLLFLKCTLWGLLPVGEGLRQRSSLATAGLIFTESDHSA